MPLLRFQLACAGRAGGRGAIRRRLQDRDRPSRRADARARGALDLLRRRHALADEAADGAEPDRRGRRRLAARRRRRDHARGQSHQRRSGALPRLSRRRRQPPVDRRPGARRRRPQGARPPSRRRRSGRGGQDRGGDLPAHLLRPHLRPPRADRGGLARRADQGDGDGRRASVDLPAHHRARHDLRAAVARRQTGDSGRGARPGAVRRDPGDRRGARHAGLRGLQPRPAGGGMPAQHGLLALRRIRRRSARARTAASSAATAGAPRRPRSTRKCG